MTKEKLQEKKNKSKHDCDDCEFKVVPVNIEPCRSCDETTDNWTVDLRKLNVILKH